jgi:hypothetical protein
MHEIKKNHKQKLTDFPSKERDRVPPKVRSRKYPPLGDT